MVEQQFDPKQWLDAIDRDWNAHRLEAALDGFTDDAIIQIVPSPPGTQATYSGKAEIRAWLTALFEQNFHVESFDHRLHGTTVSWRADARWDDLRRHGVDPFTADCEAVVADGKMRRFVIQARPETLERMQAAQAAAA